MIVGNQNKKMKTLIIPDVHQKLQKLDKILENNTFDQLISLGDWFDDFYDTPVHTQKTAEYILKLYSVYGDKFVWLLGNHDVPYLFPAMYDYYACSGNTREKAKVIKDVFKDTTKPLGYDVHLAYSVKVDNCKDIVLSHAGVSETHFSKPFVESIDYRSVFERCEEALKNTELLARDPVLSAGIARGGVEIVGGITWLDWRYEFEPISSISQIVGHTPLSVPEMVDDLRVSVLPDETLPSLKKYRINPNKTFNVNIDTHLEHYITIEGNELCIHKSSVLFE